MPERSSPPIRGTRYVAVSRFPYCALAFGDATSYGKAIHEAEQMVARNRRVAVYELKFVRMVEEVAGA